MQSADNIKGGGEGFKTSDSLGSRVECIQTNEQPSDQPLVANYGETYLRDL